MPTGCKTPTQTQTQNTITCYHVIARVGWGWGVPANHANPPEYATAHHKTYLLNIYRARHFADYFIVIGYWRGAVSRCCHSPSTKVRCHLKRKWKTPLMRVSIIKLRTRESPVTRHRMTSTVVMPTLYRTNTCAINHLILTLYTKWDIGEAGAYPGILERVAYPHANAECEEKIEKVFLHRRCANSKIGDK